MAEVNAKKMMASDNSCKEAPKDGSHGQLPSKLSGPVAAHRGCCWLVVVAAMVANLSGLMLGYEMGLTSGVLLQLRGRLSLSCQGQEMLVSAHVFGALFICLAGGPILDRYGRRCSLLLSAVLVMVGTVILIAFTTLVSLTLGRVVVGMGTCLSGTAACLYIAEISPRERRGLLVTLYEFLLVLGVMLGFSCSYAFAAVPKGWAFTFGLVIPPALLQFVAFLFLPPSPRFLVAQGNVEKARLVLEKLRGGLHKDLDIELHDLQAGLKKESEYSFKDLFSSKANLRARLLTGVALVFLQQVTGQPNILSYASPLLRSMGFTSDDAATLASTGFGVVKVVGTIPAVMLVDRVGPKSFLCVGAVVMGLSLAALGTLTIQSHTHLTSLCKSHVMDNNTLWDLNSTAAERDNGTLDLKIVPSTWATETVQRTFKENSVLNENTQTLSRSLKWVSLVTLLVYVTGFSFSLGPMVYVVVSEIFPMGIRGRAASVVGAVNWATNLLISMTFLTVTEKVGLPTILFLYAGMCFVLLVFVILCVPDTKGRTLEEISKELAKKNYFEGRLCFKKQTQDGLMSGCDEAQGCP